MGGRGTERQVEEGLESRILHSLHVVTHRAIVAEGYRNSTG